MEVFLLLPMATGLHLHIPKVAMVNDSACSDVDLKRRLHERVGSSALAVKRFVCYLPAPSGLRPLWDAVLATYSHRCAALRAPPARLKEMHWPATASFASREAVGAESSWRCFSSASPRAWTRVWPVSRRPLRHRYVRLRCMPSRPPRSPRCGNADPPGRSALLWTGVGRGRSGWHFFLLSWTSSATAWTTWLRSMRRFSPSQPGVAEPLSSHVHAWTPSSGAGPSSCNCCACSASRHCFEAQARGILRAWLRGRLADLFEHQVPNGEIELVVTLLEWGFRGGQYFWRLLSPESSRNPCAHPGGCPGNRPVSFRMPRGRWRRHSALPR